MRAHYLQHVPFEGLGSIETWLQASGYRISSTRFHAAEGLPRVEEIDSIVIMGGPMSVNDEKKYPWLVDEKKFIHQVISSGKPALGICLGAQLIADAMGGRVFPSSVKEIGWFPVQAVASPRHDVFRFPEEFVAFHWHGETFELPSKAVRMATSEGCSNQAFQFGNRVIGIQFHLETTVDSVQALITNCRDELVAGDFIQTEREILSAPQERYRTIHRLMGEILEYLHNNG